MGKEALSSLCPRGFWIEIVLVFVWSSWCMNSSILEFLGFGFLPLVAVVLDALLCD